MNILEIFELAIKMGIENDLRGEKGVQDLLKERKEEYEELSEKKKEYFDLESLKNPYDDSRILFGDGTINVDKVLTGIDIEAAEMVLADRLNEKGEGIDVVIAHHPEGKSLIGLSQVMELQVDMTAGYGVPINVVEGLMSSRIAEVGRGIAPINHYRAIDAARLLNMPLMNIHTPADNLVHHFLEERIKEVEPRKVKDVMEMLMNIKEYQEATKLGAGPILFNGKESNRAGKVVAGGITGGTSGAKEIYEKMAQAGIGTVIAMHMPEEHRMEMEKYHMNLVIAGHIASDSIGLNLLLDQLEKKGITILPCSGLIRYSRN